MQTTSYVRIYADDQGESHFEDIEVTLAPREFAPPAPPLNVAVLGETGAAALVGGEPSWHGEIAHPTPKRQLMCILSGSFATTASDGETRVCSSPVTSSCWKIWTARGTPPACSRRPLSSLLSWRPSEKRDIALGDLASVRVMDHHCVFSDNHEALLEID